MPDVDLLAILIGTAAAFVLGGAYYAILGDQLAEVSKAAARAHRPRRASSPSNSSAVSSS